MKAAAVSSSGSQDIPAARGGTSQDSEGVATISRLMLSWFTWYSRRYMRRHFHALRVSRRGLPPKSSGFPLVIYSNHASWWDPLVCLVLKSAYFPERVLAAPMEARMLERYRIFSRLGFFGVEPGTAHGARQFLRSSTAILREPGCLLALTPQGRFADVRERPPRFHSGLGHLATRVEGALFAPVAIEYVFWEERLPEVLVRFGEAIEVRRGHAPDLEAAEWTRRFEENLSATQDALEVESQLRNPEDFELILRGSAGQGGIHDWWRALKARLHGKEFRPEHGTK